MAHAILNLVKIGTPDELILEGFKERLTEKQIKRLIVLSLTVIKEQETARVLREHTKTLPKEVREIVARHEKKIQKRKEVARKNNPQAISGQKRRQERLEREAETLAMTSKIKPRKPKKKPFFVN